MLKLNERIYRFCRQPIVRRFLRETKLDPFDAVIVEHAAVPQEFRSMRYPQMQARLAKLRVRSER